jgi:hypothetical protein
MSELSPADLQTMLADEFGRQGWEYDLAVGRDLAAALREGQFVDPAQLAAKVSSDYLARNGITREDLAAAIEGAIGGNTVGAAPSTQMLVINDQRYQLHVSGSAQIRDSNLNLGGTQVNVAIDAPREDVLGGLEALLRAGFQGQWDEGAAAALADVVDGRDDISAEDISSLTAEVGAAAKADPGRIRAFLDKVATGTATALLTSGVSSGLMLLLANPPI